MHERQRQHEREKQGEREREGQQERETFNERERDATRERGRQRERVRVRERQQERERERGNVRICKCVGGSRERLRKRERLRERATPPKQSSGHIAGSSYATAAAVIMRAEVMHSALSAARTGSATHIVVAALTGADNSWAMPMVAIAQR